MSIIDAMGPMGWWILGFAIAAYAVTIGRALVLWGPHTAATVRQHEFHALSLAQAEMVQQLERHTLVRGLLFIRISIAVLPLLGLLGTVMGMRLVFSDILHSGSDVQHYGGIGEALVSTQVALALTIPLIFAERLCTLRCNRLMRDPLLAAESPS